MTQGDSQVFLRVMTFPGTAGLLASRADRAFVGDPLGLAMTLQPGVTPFLAARGEVHPTGQPLCLCFQTPGRPSKGAQHIAGRDNPAPQTPGFCGSILPAQAWAELMQGLQLPMQKSRRLCSELPSRDGRQRPTNTSPRPGSLSNLAFSNHETAMKPGPAPRFTRAAVGREEEGSKEQSITFVALSRAAVWQMSSTV